MCFWKDVYNSDTSHAPCVGQNIHRTTKYKSYSYTELTFSNFTSQDGALLAETLVILGTH